MTPLFTPTWFSDAFIALFGYPCYILTQCGIYFSTFLFIQATLTLIVKLYKTISIKYNLKDIIILFSSIAHPTGITSPPPFYTKRPKKLHLPKFKLFPKRHHFSHPKTILQTTPLPFSPDQHPSLPHYTNNHSHPNDNLATPHDISTNIPVTSDTDTPIKIYSRINYPFPPPSS